MRKMTEIWTLNAKFVLCGVPLPLVLQYDIGIGFVWGFFFRKSYFQSATPQFCVHDFYI